MIQFYQRNRKLPLPQENSMITMLFPSMPVGLIPPEGGQTQLIFNYMLSGIDVATLCQHPPDTIQFGGTLRWLLSFIIVSDPSYGLVFSFNVDLIDAYMNMWLQPENLPLLFFFTFSHPANTDKLVGFHLRLVLLNVLFLWKFIFIILLLHGHLDLHLIF